MLLINVRHQIEILYSNYLDENISSEIHLFKEVDGKKPHKIGEYRFNDVIDGFTSYLRICSHHLTQPLRAITRAIANASASRRELALLQAVRSYHVNKRR